MDPVYEPDEDTFLLATVLEEELSANLPSKTKSSCSLLDMGCGSGYLGFEARNLGANVIFADINPQACDFVKEKDKSANVIQSDLFKNISDSFDIVVFNTPYLPTEEELTDPALHGGTKGNEVALQFLDQVKSHLNKDGVVLMLTSSLSHPKEIELKATQLGFSFRIVAMKSLFFEVLYVYHFS